MRKMVADFEANGFLKEATHAHCGVFIDVTTHEVVKFGPTEIQPMLRFMDTIDELIIHNGFGYDWPLLKKLYGYEYRGKKIDTLVMSRLLNPKRLIPFGCPTVDPLTRKKVGPHSIQAWGYRVGRGKPEHNDWAVFTPEMLHRCVEDTEILLLVYEALLKEADGGDWENAFRLSFKLFENLQRQEEYGWLVDQEHMHFCIKQLTKWEERIDRVLVPSLPLLLEINEEKKLGIYKYVAKPFLQSGQPSQSVRTWLHDCGIAPDMSPVCGPFSRVGFRRVDLNSNAETKDYLLSEGWEPLEWNTNDEGARTSPKMSKDDPFEGINGKVGKLVARRVQIRQRRSILEGLLELIREDGRIASAVNTLAVTGRATHRNIVNIPAAGKSFYGKQMRRCFICPPDKVLVSTDSDSCQLRMLGGRMGSKEYIEALCTGDKSKGTDLHSLTKKIGEIESRDIAKNVIYCLLFGGGDGKLGKTAKQPGNGKQLREKLYNGFEGLGPLVERLMKEWKATAKRRFNKKFNRMEYYDGCITGLDGRPIKVPSEHQLLVYLLQSDEAIAMTAAYNRFHKRMDILGYTFGKEYGTVCFYHDEYTVECDPEIADVVAKESADAIVWAGEFFKIPCPQKGESKIGRSWFAVH